MSRVYIFLFIFFFFSTNSFGAIVITQTLGNNPNPEFDHDTFIAAMGLSVPVTQSVKLQLKLYVQQMGGERTESSEINITGGHVNSIYYQVGHKSGQHGNYFSSSSTRIQLVKREIKSGLGGFYEYNEDNYGFGTYRQVEFGPGYTWMNNLIYMGLRIEKAGGSSPTFLYRLSTSHKFKHIEGRVRAKVIIGPQYTFFENQVNDPAFGLKIKIRGQWLHPSMPENLQFSYGVNGLLINSNAGVVRRFGVELGLIYEY